MAALLVLVFSTSLLLVARASNLVHFAVSQSASNDELTVEFEYKQAMDLRASVKRTESGEFTIHAESIALKSHLVGKVEIEPSGSDKTYVASASGSIWGVNVTYNLLVISSECPKYQLWHSLDTSPADLVAFSSNVTGSCRPEGDLERVFITVHLDGEVTPLIKTRLEQVFVFEGDGRVWEEMQMQNAALDIKVKGDWPSGERGFKRATFNSKLLQYIPSFVLEYVKSEQEIVFKVIKSLVQHDEL